MKTKLSLLTAALGKPDLTKQLAPPWKGRPNGRALHQRYQCAYCKEINHWKNECPPTSTLIQGVPSPPYMCMKQYTRKEDC
jgi:hypothetical protein